VDSSGVRACAGGSLGDRRVAADGPRTLRRILLLPASRRWRNLWGGLFVLRAQVRRGAGPERFDVGVGRAVGPGGLGLPVLRAALLAAAGLA
jgi:hypothetical protein